MLTIRQNVFETNSSSTHSVSLNFSACSILGSYPPDKKGIITLNGGDFASACDSIYSIGEKLNFVAVCIHVLGDEEIKERFERIVKEHTGAKEIKYDIRTSYS